MKKRDAEIDRTLHRIDRYVFIAQMGQENFLRENSFVSRESTSFFHNGIDDYPIMREYSSVNPIYQGNHQHGLCQYPFPRNYLWADIVNLLCIIRKTFVVIVKA